MSESKTASDICFVGGDKRQLYAAIVLSEQTDRRIIVSGEAFLQGLEHRFYKNVKYEPNPVKAIHSASVVVLPLPAASSEREISFIDIVSEIKQRDGIMIGGLFSPYMLDVLEEENIRHADYFNDESFTVKNAYITAEGAVALAMNALDKTLREASCTVLGFGRIGKALAQMLLALGCRTTVYARRAEARALAREMGFGTVDRVDLSGSDLIFNTVPQRIVANEDLLDLESGRIFIELASTPGGFDRDIAVGCSHTVIDGKGLPGKYAPESAGRAVAESVGSALKIFGFEMR